MSCNNYTHQPPHASKVDEATREAARLSGAGWEELAEHFTLNLDEANNMANMSSAHIVGYKGIRKHEKNQNDSRVSITSVECGSAAGVDGPSVYLLRGDKMPKKYNNLFGNRRWLQRHGAPPNSFVAMTPEAFMTNDTWDTIVPELVKGIRAMPVIRDHPNFWVILHLDGFKSHVMTLKAQMMFRHHRILVVKENSHSSQINQAFDQAPAKAAKAENRRWLPLIRDRQNLVTSVDQWALLCAVMTGQDGGRGKLWTSGFIRVNLHPKHMLPIEVWLSKIADALTAAGGTEGMDAGYGRNYLRLIRVPKFFAELTPERRSEMKALTDNISFDWTGPKLASLPDWIQLQFKKDNKALHSFFKFSNHMAMSVRRGLADPSDTLPSQALARRPAPKAQPEPQRLINKRRVANAGLDSYKFSDSALAPKERFKQMCLHRSRFAGNNLSDHLDICTSPDQERIILKANARDLSIGSFLDSALDANVGKGLASRKLNLLGEIDGMACIVNSPERLRRLRQARHLQSALGGIKQTKATERKRKKAKKQADAERKSASDAIERPIIELLENAGYQMNARGTFTNTILIKFLRENKLFCHLPKDIDGPLIGQHLLPFFWSCARMASTIRPTI